MRTLVALRARAPVCTIAAACVVGCGTARDPDGDEGLAPAAVAEPTRKRDEPASASWAERLSAPDVATVLAALDRTHAVMRDRVGPHRIEWDATYALVPTDGPAHHGEHLVDALRLTWTTPDGRGPRFRLSQRNDHDRGREIVVVAGQLYTRLEHRPFEVLPLESDVHEAWLDDALHGARDAIAFVAPALTMTAKAEPGAGLSGGDAVVLTLGRGATTDPRAPGPGTRHGNGDRSAWRADARFEAISGELRLDAVTGQWLTLDLDVRYALASVDRTLRGSFVFHGRTLVLGDEDARIVAPADALPLPTRTRLAVERESILDGLAAP